MLGLTIFRTRRQDVRFYVLPFLSKDLPDQIDFYWIFFNDEPILFL